METKMRFGVRWLAGLVLALGLGVGGAALAQSTTPTTDQAPAAAAPAAAAPAAAAPTPAPLRPPEVSPGAKPVDGVSAGDPATPALIPATRRGWKPPLRSFS